MRMGGIPEVQGAPAPLLLLRQLVQWQFNDTLMTARGRPRPSRSCRRLSAKMSDDALFSHPARCAAIHCARLITRQSRHLLSCLPLQEIKGAAEGAATGARCFLAPLSPGPFATAFSCDTALSNRSRMRNLCYSNSL
jgi:hypothetical protein